MCDPLPIVFVLISSKRFISFQNYVSALQKRVQPGYQPPSEHSTKTNSHERNTLNSDRTDRTHFTNIVDSDIDKIDFGDQHSTG